MSTIFKMNEILQKTLQLIKEKEAGNGNYVVTYIRDPEEYWIKITEEGTQKSWSVRFEQEGVVLEDGE